MKRFSAQFIITNSGPPVKRAVITAEDDGTIINIEESNGSLKEQQSVEFFNGIIIPGFVNCHCHLELSHLRGIIAEGTGLGNFIMQVRSIRNKVPVNEESSASAADSMMKNEGIVLCADVCNTSATFNIKKTSSIRYLNLLEVFGIDPEKAEKRMNEIIEVSREADEAGLPYSLIPHSAYAVSLPLLRLIKEKTVNNKVTSIHFLETDAEIQFVTSHSGPLRKSYEETGLLPVNIQLSGSHITAIRSEVTSSGNLILVHNTFADKMVVNEVTKRGGTFWCLCPVSNMFIEKKMPPVRMLMEENCEIVIGTDSLASNRQLSILSELKLIQQHFPDIPLEEMIRWSTINGARALGEDCNFGSIKPGMKPGLLLLDNVDLANFKLLPDTFIKRLV